jgi:hypothetical protein
LFVSLGCATENLVQAALAHGLSATPKFDAADNDGIRVQLDPALAARTPLFEAIPRRQSTRTEYDGKPVANDELSLLERGGAGNGTRMLLLTSREVMEKALEYVVQGNTAQLNDPAFIRELKSWIRFGDAEAVRSGDGLFSRTTGNPSVPRWIGSLLFKRLLCAMEAGSAGVVDLSRRMFLWRGRLSYVLVALVAPYILLLLVLTGPRYLSRRGKVVRPAGNGGVTAFVNREGRAGKPDA